MGVSGQGVAGRLAALTRTAQCGRPSQRDRNRLELTTLLSQSVLISVTACTQPVR